MFGGVYKLVAVEHQGEIIPRIKISENVQKITNPYFKKVVRLYSNETGMAIADVLTTYDEVIDDALPYEIFDPQNTWKRKVITDFKAVELQVPIFQSGKLVYAEEELSLIWDEVKRFENPHTYYVDLSQKLWDIRYDLLKAYNA